MKRILSVLAALIVLSTSCSTFALIDSSNPMITPYRIDSYIETENDCYNLLILGVDLAYAGYDTSGNSGAVKHNNLAGCHTDAVMLVSIDRTNGALRLLSFPRDTFVYVPGERGIYKLNAAFNCADSIDDGFERVCDTVSWLCGGIRVDAYACVDIEAMIALGDAMGGVDFKLDMSYTGSEHRHYKAGQQHLDGRGMMDYVRARRNATVDISDIGRTGRQRKMMIAVFQKLKQDPALVATLWDTAMNSNLHFYTNIDEEVYGELYQIFTEINNTEVKSYVMDATLLSAMGGWNMNFTKQDERARILNEMFGITVEDIPYVSYKYSNWLMDRGLIAVKYINLTKNILRKASSMQLTEEQTQAVKALDAQYDETVKLFDAASASMTDKDNNALRDARNKLREMAEQTAQLIGYGTDFVWRVNEFWYRDASVNGWTEIDWR